MLWKLAADAVVVVHFLWILFIIFGAVIGRRIGWAKWLHIGALIFSILLQVFGWICPLTYLEVWLRNHHDPSLAYTGDFIAHYAERLVYLQAPRLPILLATFVVITLSCWAYWPHSTAKRPE